MSKREPFYQYLPGVIIQNASDDRAYFIGSYDTFLSLEDALKVIEQHKENNTVLCAWVRKMNKNIFKGTVWFENYTNTLGMVNDRFVMKEG